jgi:hypothetical protein
MKKAKSNHIKKIILYLIILIGIILLIWVLTHSAFVNYHSWKEHHSYFKNNTSPNIESWMTFKIISSRFNLINEDILKEIGANKTQINKHMTLDRFCKVYKQNCTEIVKKLNMIVKK